MGIYMIRNIINNKMYIGQTNDFKRRWSDHKKNLRGNRHDNHELQKDWNEYGENNFEFKIIKECSEDELDILEQKFIEEFKTFDNGYNYTLGGVGWKGAKHSDESKSKISDNHADVKGKNAPFYGRKHTKESKDKMRMAKIGKKASKETKDKLSIIMKGKRSGENNPMYGKRGKDNPNYGRKASKETKDKIREARINNAKKYICIYPNGEYTEPMTRRELSKHLKISLGVIREIILSNKPYVPKVKRLEYLRGIIILENKR